MKKQPRDAFRVIAGEIFWVLGGTGLIALSGAGLNILIGNLFGDEGLGTYTLLMSLYLGAGTLAGLGLPGAVTKFATEHKTDSENEERYLSAALLLSLPGAILLLLLLWAFREEIAVLLKTQNLAPLLGISALGIPLFAANKMILARMRGLRRIRNFAIGESSRGFLLFCLTGIFVFLHHSLTAAALALVLSEAILFLFLLLAGRIDRKVHLTGLRRPAGDLAGYGRRILLSRLFLELDGRIAFLLAGYFLGAGEVGVLSVAFLLTQVLTFFPAALQKVTGPVITELHLAGRTDTLQNFIEKTMAGSLFLLSAVALLLWWGFRPLIAFIYPGREIFQQALLPYGILAVGLVLRGGTGSVGSVFVSIGRPDIVMKLSPIRLLVNLLVSLVLVSFYGISGIAAGTSAAGAAVFLLWIVAMNRIAGIHLQAGRIAVFPLLALTIGAISVPTATFLPGWAVDTVLFLVYGIFGWRYMHLGYYLVRLFRGGTPFAQQEAKR